MRRRLGSHRGKLIGQPDLRAAFRLARELHCTVAELGQRMTAAEFAYWQVYLAEEPLPAPLLQAHWQMLAAAHNGGQVKRRDGQLFTPADFAAPLWQAPSQAPAAPAPPPLTAELLRQQVAALWGNR